MRDDPLEVWILPSLGGIPNCESPNYPRYLPSRRDPRIAHFTLSGVEIDRQSHRVSLMQIYLLGDWILRLLLVVQTIFLSPVKMRSTNLGIQRRPTADCQTPDWDKYFLHSLPGFTWTHPDSQDFHQGNHLRPGIEDEE